MGVSPDRRWTHAARCAHRYATLGWRVLPLEGKRPHRCLGFRGGVHHASSNPVLVQAWWETHPDASVGLACDGWVALDIDPRHGGDREMRRLLREHSDGQALPRGGVARTGGNGWHYLFSDPGAKLRGKLADGVDLKSAGGYIVAAPSVHPETRERYRWLVEPHAPGELPPMPAWLVELATVREPPPSGPRHETTAPADVVERARRYARKLDPAISGQGGHGVAMRAAVLVVRGFGLSVDDAMTVLDDEWNGRCEPPWSERELRHKVASAEKEGRMPWGALVQRDRGAA